LHVFLLGVLANIVAAIVYEYARRRLAAKRL
jgi:hypothetical protein